MTMKPSRRPRGSPGRLGALVWAFALLLPGCAEDGADDTLTLYRCGDGQWAADTGGYRAWGHDCDLYFGDHFTIYSDGSSHQARQQLADMAEAVFVELVDEFQVVDIETELGFVDGYSYYIYAEKHLPEIVNEAYRNGLLLAAIDCVTTPGAYQGDPARYRSNLKHELTHTFQFTLTDCPSNAACPNWLGFWFREGQAIYMSGAGEAARVSTPAQLRTWQSVQGRANPISIHRFTDFPNQDRFGEYYPVFGLAYAYLVDPEHGHGATVNDMRHLFQSMADGTPFHEAFERTLGMSVAYYEEHFYSLAEMYLMTLAQGEPYTASGYLLVIIGLVLLLAVGTLTVLAVVWLHRRRRRLGRERP